MMGFPSFSPSNGLPEESMMVPAGDDRHSQENDDNEHLRQTHRKDNEVETYNFDFGPETMRAIEDMIPGFIELMMLFSEHIHIPEKFPEEGFDR